MNKKTEVVVKLEWIENAIAINSKGSCDFHMTSSTSTFCSGCGCCQLARAYLDAKSRQKPASGKKPGVRRCENHPRREATHQAFVKDCGKNSHSGCDFEAGTPGHKRTRHYCSFVCPSCAERELAAGFGTVRI